MILRLFLTILLITLATPAFARDVIGTVIEIEGSATRTMGKASMPLNNDDPIYLGDTLMTYPHSRLLVLLADDTQITLGENATLNVDKYIYDPQSAATPKADFSILRGSFLFISGLISKDPRHDLNVKTSYGTIGLRGTTVWGGLIGDEYGVLVQDGDVIVTNNGGTTLVGKNQGTFMKNANEKPRDPTLWPQKKIDIAIKSIAMKRQAWIETRLNARKRANAKGRSNAIQLLPLDQKLEHLKKLKEKTHGKPIPAEKFND